MTLLGGARQRHKSNNSNSATRERKKRTGSVSHAQVADDTLGKEDLLFLYFASLLTGSFWSIDQQWIAGLGAGR